MDELEGLDVAVGSWLSGGPAAPLERWLARCLDGDGTPVRLPVAAWGTCLARLAEARRGREECWPEWLDVRIEGLFRSVLRFARPDGAPVFGPPGAPEGTKALYRDWAGRLSDAGLATIVGWWYPTGRGPRSYASPPLPADCRPDRVLAMLRADWSKSGDLAAVDHRESGPTSRLELTGLGATWLGPSWVSGPAGADQGRRRARPRRWISNSSADLLEWSFPAGERRVLRTALMLRGRRLALLADLVEGAAAGAEMRIGLPDQVVAHPLENGRGLALTGAGRARGSFHVLPLGLPALPYPTERGAFGVDGRALVLTGAAAGPRCWLPLLASWDPVRNRRPVRWRLLTVSEKSRVCPPEVAFAVRVTWGRDGTLVVYRSLARPALRAFLGHQTRARLLIGLFDASGNVAPILRVDD